MPSTPLIIRICVSVLRTPYGVREYSCSGRSISLTMWLQTHALCNCFRARFSVNTKHANISNFPYESILRVFDNPHLSFRREEILCLKLSIFQSTYALCSPALLCSCFPHLEWASSSLIEVLSSLLIPRISPIGKCRDLMHSCFLVS